MQKKVTQNNSFNAEKSQENKREKVGNKIV